MSRGWSLHASYGEGFKAPSLFQLFSDFGNAALQPERSRSFDLGLGSGDRNGGTAFFDLTLFRRDTRGLIGFVSCFGVSDGICTNRPFGTYDNIGRARAQGVEVEGGLRIGEQVTASAAYSYLEAKDRTRGAATEGNALARRPRHALSTSLDWQPAGPLRLGADLRVVSHSYDDAANLVPARLTAALIAATSGQPLRTARGTLTDADRTPSPNAGWPMAAAAHALGLRLEKREHHILNTGAPEPGADDIARARRLLARALVLGGVLATLGLIRSRRLP